MDAAPPPVPTNQPATPAYRLYKLSGIAVASFLGGPIGGTWLAASNYRRTGDRKAARNALIIGIGSTIVLLTLAFLLPDSMPRKPFSIGVPIATYYALKPFMQPLISAHEQRGGEMRSSWLAVPIGLACSVALFVSLFGVLVLADFLKAANVPGTHVAMSDKEEVIYSGGSTESDARTLGESMKKLGLFDGKQNRSVFLERTLDGEIVVSVITAEATTDSQKEQVERFVRMLGEALKPLYSGKPFSVRMLDKDLQVKGSFRIE